MVVNRDYSFMFMHNKERAELSTSHVRAHEKLLTISLENFHEIRKVYRDVLGLQHIDHLSINIIDPKNEMVFLSSTPMTGINVFINQLQQYDYSINPKVFSRKSFYWWDSCYDAAYYKQLKLVKEQENNLSMGFICCEKIEEFYFLYSFASRTDRVDIRTNILDFRDNFISMGRYCYRGIKHIYERYSAIEPPII